MKLYELTEQYESLATLAVTSDDEADAKAFADSLEGLRGEIQDKLENCAAVVKSIEAECTAIREEEKRLANRRRSIENATDRLKLYMQESMTTAQLEKVKGTLFTISIQDNPPRVEVDNDQAIPEDYKRIKWEVDKANISSVLKSGVEIPGVHLEYTRSLRIR